MLGYTNEGTAPFNKQPCYPPHSLGEGEAGGRVQILQQKVFYQTNISKPHKAKDN